MPRFTQIVLALSIAVVSFSSGESSSKRLYDLSSLLDLPFHKVFDPIQDGTGSWKNGKNNPNISFQNFKGIATIRVNKSPNTWIALQKEVQVNLDQYPVLDINVLTASKRWYLILSGPQFENGYIRLKETVNPGAYSFDIAQMTGLSGIQKFAVKIGISNHNQQPLAQEQVSLDLLSFRIRKESRGKQKNESSVDLRKNKFLFKKKPFSPIHVGEGPELDLWEESEEGGPREVRLSTRKNLAIVRGKMNRRSWGALQKKVSIDLDDFKLLEIVIDSCSKNWYLVLASPKLPGGYIRLKETGETGAFDFDIPALTGLHGKQNFRLKLGISNPNGPSIRGEWLAFSHLGFRSAK